MNTSACLESEMPVETMATAQETQRSTTILVVDDSPLILKYVRMALEPHGYRVETSESFWVAGLVNKLRPSLVLMDLNFGSGLSAKMGSTAIQALRTMRSGRNLTIVLHSSADPETLADAVAESSADGFIHKDGNAETLLAEVRDFLDARKEGN